MKKPEQELAEIKSMMERSTRFLSLSGLSGVLAGIYALIGAGITWYWIFFPETEMGKDAVPKSFDELLNGVLVLGVFTLILALYTAWMLGKKKSHRASTPFLTPAGKRFLMALFIPVISGGLFCFALLHEAQFHLIPAATLIFYGLGLMNASHFTLSEIKNLGFGQLVVGLLAAFFPQFGLLCWAIGFGVLHVVYGSMMYYKYDR